MAERIQLDQLTVEIDDEARTVTSIWPDGAELVAKPNYDEESMARARALGYAAVKRCDLCEGLGCVAKDFGRIPEFVRCPDCQEKRLIVDEENSVWAMCRDHDLFHHLVARAEGEPWSWHLYEVAGGEEGIAHRKGWEAVDGDREERLVLLLQRAVNSGRDGLLKSERHSLKSLNWSRDRRLGMAEPCTTFGCERPAVAEVSIEDQGWFPYCEDCAESLERSGDEVRWELIDLTAARLTKLQAALREEIERLRGLALHNATVWHPPGHDGQRRDPAYTESADRLEKLLKEREG